MKACQRRGCGNQITRGKFCIEHRTVRRKATTTPSISEEEQERLSQLYITELLEKEEREREYENDRILRTQQELDFTEAQTHDMENLKAKHNEIERKAKIRQKFQDYTPQDFDATIQFTIPHLRLRIKQPFHITTTLRDLFDFVEMVLEENNNNDVFQLVNYPNMVYNRGGENDHLIISELNILHGTSLFVQPVFELN